MAIATETYEAPAGDSAEASSAVRQPPWPSPSRAYYTVFVMALVVMFAEIDRSIMSLLVQSIKADLHLSDSDMGLLMGVMFALFYAACGLPLARYIDRRNRKNLLAIALGVWSTATVFCGLAQNFVQLAVARLFLGAGESVNGPAIFSIISDSFPKEKLPRGIALMQVGVMAGNAFALIMGSVVIGMLVHMPPLHLAGMGIIRWWQMVFIVIGVPGLLVAAITAMSVKEPARRGLLRTGKGDQLGMSQVLRYIWTHRPVYMPMYVSMGLTGLAMGVIAWNPAFYQRTYGWSAQHVGMVMGLVSLVATPLGLFSGVAVSEWLSKKGFADAPYRVIVWGRLIALAPVILQPLMPTPGLALLMYGGYLTLVGVTGSCQNAVLQIVSPSNMRGQATALLMFLYSVVGNGLSPYLLGLITDHVFHQESQLRYAMLLVNVLFMPASLVVFWLGIGPYRRELKRLGLDTAAA
jgi:MFS family permease